MLQYRVQTSAKVTPHGPNSFGKHKETVGKAFRSPDVENLDITNFMLAKFHFPYFSKFKFSGTQKTHFREYPFSRIPILSVVKDFELKNPFSRKPIFARIDCTIRTIPPSISTNEFVTCDLKSQSDRTF